MIVGIVRLVLRFPGAGSERDRQRLMRRLVDRLRARFNASVADVSGDEPRVGTLAASVVGCERSAMDAALDKIVAEVESTVAGEALVVARDTEVQSYGGSEPLGALDYTPMAKGAMPMARPKRRR